MNRNAKLMIPLVAAALAAGCKPPADPEQKVPVPATVKSFSASPTAVVAGEKTTLTWSAENATSVSITTLDGTALTLPANSTASGSVEAAVERTTVFVLTARGEGGSDTAAAAVSVGDANATPFLAAVPGEVVAGRSTTLVWNAPGATSVTIRDGAGAQVYAGDKSEGSLDVSPSYDTTYTLEAAGKTASTSVAVLPEVLAFVANPGAVYPGDKVTLSWSTGGADSVTISAEGRGTLFTTTQLAQMVDGSFEDQVSVSLPSNGLVQYKLVAVRGTRTIERALTVWVGVDPKITAFTLPQFGRLGGSFRAAWKISLANRISLEANGVVIHESVTAAEVADGGFDVPIGDGPVTLVLRAWNDRGGVATQSGTVLQVGNPTLNAFSASPTGIGVGGEPITLSWDVPEARHVRITEKDRGVLYDYTGVSAEQGSLVVYTNKAAEYVLEADNTLGNQIAPTSVNISVATPAKLVQSPAAAPLGALTEISGTTAPNGGAIFRLPSFNAPGDAFEDIAATANDISISGTDSGVAVKDLGETFTTTLFGKPVSATKVTIAVNGWLGFGSLSDANDTPKGPAPTDSLSPNTFAPLYHDLEKLTGGAVYKRLDTVGTERRLIVQWKGFAHDDIPNSSFEFQVQIYSGGRVVYAYKTLGGIDFMTPVIGIVGQTPGDTIWAPFPLKAGDTLRLTDVQPPYMVRASRTPVSVEVAMPDGILQMTSGMDVLPDDFVAITEVMYNPTLADGEWLEVQNRTSSPLDLNGWLLEIGATQIPIVGAPVIAPGGFLVLGQTATSAEDGSPGGAPVGFVYGTGVTMPNSAGMVALRTQGVIVAQAIWTTAGTTGVSARMQHRRALRYSSAGVYNLACASTTPFGAGTQNGSPGAAAPLCHPWELQAIPGAFQSIATTGMPITGMLSTGDNSIDTIIKQVDFTTLAGRGVRIGTQVYGVSGNVLSVSSNGFVALGNTTEAATGNEYPVPLTTGPNSVIAPFWDDLSGNPGANSGVYWQQFDPDGVPSTGDEYTLISWENWKRWASAFSTPVVTSDLNFQVKFLEGTGSVEFHYGDMTSSRPSYRNGQEATIWMDTAGTTALVVGSNQPVIEPNTGYRFTYTP